MAYSILAACTPECDGARMQTRFTLAQLADPDLRDAERVLRTCVHCGFCLATCPTYVLLGDERDSPRGRIYFIKEMLEKARPATATVARHVDRCLSCLSCMTTCPSGVDYRKLVDHARVHIERTLRRPLLDRLARWWLAKILPNPGLFRLALRGARAVRPVIGSLPRAWVQPRLLAMLGSLPRRVYARSSYERGVVAPANGERRGRVALLSGCVQHAVAPQINDATVRLLNRHGVEVVVVPGAGCCGALAYHLGREREARQQAQANIQAWTVELKAGGFDAVVVNAAGCGDMIKSYGALFAHETGDLNEAADRAEQIASLARDVSEILIEIGLKASHGNTGVSVAYQPACALEHGQRVVDQPRALLSEAGFQVVDVPEAHLCCGSAGAYSLLQPDLAGQLISRKVANIERTGAPIVAAGNIGCMMQIGRATRIPVVHTVELLDWATGGPKPEALGGDATA